MNDDRQPRTPCGLASSEAYRELIVRGSRARDPVTALEEIRGWVRRKSPGRLAPDLPRPSRRPLQKLLASLLMRAGEYREAGHLLSRGPCHPPLGTEDALVLDPGFVHLEGHHHNSNVFFRRMVEGRGLHVAVLRNDCQHSSFEHDETSSLPFFSLSPYESPFPPSLELSEQLRLLNRFFSEEFSRVLSEHPARLLVVPVARHTFVEGFAQALRRRGNRRPVSLLLGIVETTALDERDSSYRAVLDTYRKAASILKSIEGLRALVVVETREVSAYLHECVGLKLPTVILPYVAGYLDELEPKDRASDPPVVGYVGQSRPERGAFVIPEVVEKTLSNAGLDLSWKLQIDPAVLSRNSAHDALEALERLRDHPCLDLVPTNLGLRDYYRLLRDIDVMVMPYASRYSTTGSGIAAESLRAGHVQVFPKGSSMDRQARELGAGTVLIEDLSPEGVARCIEDSVRRIAELHPRSLRAAALAGADTRILAELRRFVEAA